MPSPTLCIAAVSRTAVALVFAAAALSKLLSSRVDAEGARAGVAGFAHDLAAQTIIPHALALPAATLILCAELALALLGLSHRAVRAWAWTSLLLLAIARNALLSALASFSLLPAARPSPTAAA